jgi:protein phosphatase
METMGGVIAALATDVGRVRAHNEDAGLITSDLVAVADGMGGHAAGEVASSLAVEALREVGESAASGEAGGLRPKDVLDAVQAANRAILQSVARNPEQTGMATTLAGLARVTVGGSPHWAVFNIGDSRVYRVVDGRLTQVSTDHSEVAELVSLGLLTPQEALVHPARNIVTRCLGREPLEPVDSWVFPPHAGERFLLCTDGLTNELRDPTIARILGDGDDPQAIADRLVAAAVDAGGRDNVTVVVVLGSPVADGGASHEADEETAPRNGSSEGSA